MNRTLPALALFGACAASFGGVALAHDVALDGPIEVPENSDAYVTSDGEAVRTGDGHCLRLGGISEDDRVDACEGIEEAVVEVEPEPEPEPEPAPPPEPVARVELRDVSDRTFFEFDSVDMTAEGEAEMEAFLAELRRYDDVTDISVIGHTDAIGTEEYNLELSERRAAAIGALMSAAFPDARIALDGRGESDPIATNETPEGRQMNRRVEIELTASETTFE